MEGFYYDTEIERIAEIVKNTLYFAVLASGQSKILKNSREIYYFTIDNELTYTNYYLDFGPLNISCLYKYCCKVNNCLQYAQGVRKVVHYTTSNPIKRVNAAYLMGCYGIIYLKMNPKEVYGILSNTGGQFKAFVDASQGYSQYTLHILDCFNAVQKALSFNFFNFSDFNVVEYDVYDKLQNGDMNWLLPRKFLAFIGPSDNDLLNGHPPDFYIDYFLDNDVKTVVRLNNRVYDASAFTSVGIDHHELFFPDGTVPSKEILIKFLDISENSRAAIAVHCKAGLGRTGSLIGAYIIKHYQMSAHEAIAWMRICRPGSVIGQQQLWLEKIENWLWNQGSQYRLQQFGEGDKIPHHKYGIYSKTWPKERQKLIRHVQRKRLQTYSNNYEPKKSHRDICSGPEVKSAEKKTNKNTEGTDVQNTMISKSIEKNHKYPLNDPLMKNKKFPDIQRKYIQPLTMFISNETPLFKCQNVSDIEDNRPLHVQRQKRYVNIVSSNENQPETSSKANENDDIQRERSIQAKLKKRNENENRRPSRIRNCLVENFEQTQGDKLNAIKAKRCPNPCDQKCNARSCTIGRRFGLDENNLPKMRNQMPSFGQRSHF